MPGITEALNGLIDTMTGSATPKPGGQSFVTDVLPRPGQLEVAEVLNGAIDLTWITKDIRFSGDSLETELTPAVLDTSIIGGMPIPVLGTTGVPGLLGQLGGTLPLLNQTKVSVKFDVSWRALDERGSELPSSEWSAPGGLEGPKIAIAFAPEIIELTSSVVAPSPTIRKLRATVKLTVAGVPPVERDLPDVPVPVLPLPIPKVVAAFLHTNFQPRSGDDDGGVFVMVPSDSPLKNAAQLNSTLSSLQTAVGNLAAFAKFAGFLLGLNDLLNAVAAQPYFAMAATNVIEDLNDITIIQNSWYENDIELEDELSSMIFIGPATARLEIFCETEFDDENGHGILSLPDSCAVVVRSLHHDVPPTQPPDLWQTVKVPDHSIVDPDGFGDWTSSLRFV